MNSQISAPENQHCNLARPLVLSVDDNRDNLDLLNQILAMLKCSFVSARDGQTALITAQQSQPDLILLDLMLPDMSGLEVIKKLKQDGQTMSIPIIAVSAMARVQDRDSALMCGCIDYIKKPYIIQELELIILPYLRSPKGD